MLRGSDFPLKDLFELHERAGFPIKSFYIKFKDYDWLVRFFLDCFNSLVAQGKIKYYLSQKMPTKWGPGLSSLEAYLIRTLKHSKLGLHSTIKRKLAVPAPVINFLAKECRYDILELQGQVDYLFLGNAGKAAKVNPSAKILSILHNSPNALTPYQISRMMGSMFGVNISVHRTGACISDLHKNNYLIRRGPKGAPYFTLRGEEHKFKTA